jgi:hypothetical protein
VFDLTAVDGPECQTCHVVKNASIMRVQSDQDVMSRAEFNHRAHILEKRCTECHTAIEIDEQKLKMSVLKYSEFKEQYDRVYKADRSITQNIPDLESCLQCHTARKAAVKCVTCHNFHPNKQNRSNLQLTVRK